MENGTEEKKAMKPIQASKWLKSQALIDTEEMAHLFDTLDAFKLYMAGCVTPIGEGELSRRRFLDLYHEYISALREGRRPDINRFRQPFSSAMTVDDTALFVMPVQDDKQLMRVCKPVVQMQLHTMGYSDGEFRSMTLGKESMLWGIQFSYPQLFQDPEQNDIVKVDSAFPNTELFRSIQRWMRRNTIPTPFIVKGVQINASQRLGKRCLNWINDHPDLKEVQVHAG